MLSAWDTSAPTSWVNNDSMSFCFAFLRVRCSLFGFHIALVFIPRLCSLYLARLVVSSCFTTLSLVHALLSY